MNKNISVKKQSNSFIKSILAGFTGLIFPPLCPCCDQRLSIASTVQFCGTCRAGLTKLVDPLCRICGKEVIGDPAEPPLCGECLQRTPPFTLARSCYPYNEALQTVIHKLKFSKDHSVLPAIGELVRSCDLITFADCEYIVPVPLHLARLRQRGFNQSSLLAEIFFPHRTEDIIRNQLKRIKNNPPQSSLGGAERRKDLKQAFTLRESSLLREKNICLVDDVYTTGTTVAECSRALLRGGVKEVKVLTFGRVEERQNCSRSNRSKYF